jgi:low molecular weight protein-tyrosine phosphatase
MTPPPLPAPRRSGTPYRIALVCLGNICRSPIADVVLNHRLASAGLDGDVEVVSAGTGDWHVGNPMDRRAAALLTSHGYDASRHRAQLFEAHWFEEQDLVLAMDESNAADLRAEFGDTLDDPARLKLFREFDPRAHDGDREVPDPYYGGDDGFATVLAIVERTCDEIVFALDRELVGG